METKNWRKLLATSDICGREWYRSISKTPSYLQQRLLMSGITSQAPFSLNFLSRYVHMAWKLISHSWISHTWSALGRPYKSHAYYEADFGWCFIKSFKAHNLFNVEPDQSGWLPTSAICTLYYYQYHTFYIQLRLPRTQSQVQARFTRRHTIR